MKGNDLTLQGKMYDCLVDVCRNSDANPADAMGAAMSAALNFVLLVSEVSGRNQLKDLYFIRRKLTELIKEYRVKI